MNIKEHTFKFRTGDTDEKGGCTFIGGSWVDKTTDELFKGKRIVMFSLPGAFTPTCSGEELPSYDRMYQKFKDKGIDDVYCVSVNDGFVMRSWGASMTPKVEKVFLCPDGDGKFTEAMGMLVDKPKQGFGKRSWRYSAFIDNGKILKMFVENNKNNESNDNDPFEVSNVETMLSYLKSTLVK